MGQKIIYTNPLTNNLSIIGPSPWAGISVEQIALKDVPHGLPYLIVDDADIPSDYKFQAAWEADFSEPHGVGADYGTGSNNEVTAWNDDGTPVVRFNT